MENKIERHTDVVLFVNGLPLGVWHTQGSGKSLTMAFYAGRIIRETVLGDETLRAIACELVDTVRKNVTIDWTIRENVRAKLRTTRWDTATLDVESRSDASATPSTTAISSPSTQTERWCSHRLL